MGRAFLDSELRGGHLFLLLCAFRVRGFLLLLLLSHVSIEPPLAQLPDTYHGPYFQHLEGSQPRLAFRLRGEGKEKR